MAVAESSSTRDRLSELPNSLLHTILSFLDMRDVVRTTLLSKRWNNLWTTLPFLHFQSFYGSVSTKNFVNRALESWKGTKIVQFSLNFVIFVLIPSDIVDSWLHFAIKKQVEDLYLNLRGSKFESHHRLYSCSSLRKLSILCFESKQLEEGRVKWNRLKSLLIKFSCYLNEDVMNKVIRGSPHLEILDLRFVQSDNSLNIESTSLKMLRIQYDGFGCRQKAFLRISAPNLETLEIFEVLYRRCLWNVPCLTNVLLDISDQDYMKDKDGCNNYWDDKFLELRPVFLCIRSVEKLTLSDWCFKVLEKLKEKDKVVGDYDHEMFPKPKTMLIKPSNVM